MAERIGPVMYSPGFATNITSPERRPGADWIGWIRQVTERRQGHVRGPDPTPAMQARFGIQNEKITKPRFKD